MALLLIASYYKIAHRQYIALVVEITVSFTNYTLILLKYWQLAIAAKSIQILETKE